MISVTLHCTAMTDHYGGRGARPEDGTAAAGRVASFADGVFAIAITLLVLPLTEARLTDAGLAGELRTLRPQLFAFALSFLIIGRFWLAHHRIFRHIVRLDGRLLALNLLVLLCVAFLPFPTKVVGEHGSTTVAAVFYAASTAGTGLAFAVLWFYASAGRRLVHPQVDLALVRRLRWRSLVSPVMFLASIPVALVSPPAAEALWSLSIPVIWVVEQRL